MLGCMSANTLEDRQKDEQIWKKLEVALSEHKMKESRSWKYSWTQRWSLGSMHKKPGYVLNNMHLFSPLLTWTEIKIAWKEEQKYNKQVTPHNMLTVKQEKRETWKRTQYSIYS